MSSCAVIFLSGTYDFYNILFQKGFLNDLQGMDSVLLDRQAGDEFQTAREVWWGGE